jgi:hypothetical protein
MLQAVPLPIIRSSKLYTQHQVFVELFLLFTAIMGEVELTIAVRSRKCSTNIRCCVYSFELLMMGGGTACNMWSNYSNKYHCVMLHLVGCA